MSVGKSRGAQRSLDLVDSDIPDHALAQRNVTHSVNQREDFNVPDLVLSERLRGGLLTVSRTDKPDRFVQSKRCVSTGCAKHQVAARNVEHRSALP